jgi:FMN phosphatase YigB (HAD superfamily)
MKKPVILFDIDHTLLDTSVYRNEVLKGVYRKSTFQKSLLPFSKQILIALKKHSLGIFSQEKGQNQLKKLKLSSLTVFFNKNLIFIYKDEDIALKILAEKLTRYHPIILVDDYPPKIENFRKKITNSVGIRIKRGKYKNLEPQTQKFAPQFTLKTLKDVSKIVSKII